MRVNGQRRQPLARSGFTLLEMLLVLALVVAVTALAIPALSGPLENNRLRRAADQVRAAWVSARVQAMEKGRTFVFQYVPGTDQFTLEPWMSGDDYLESDQLLTLGMDASGQSLAGQASVAPRVKKLPENIVFVASETAADMRAQLIAVAAPDQAADAQVSPPVFFYPDGTTSTARLVLANQRNRIITVTMRGLTGVVQVSDLQAGNGAAY